MIPKETKELLRQGQILKDQFILRAQFQEAAQVLDLINAITTVDSAVHKLWHLIQRKSIRKVGPPTNKEEVLREGEFLKNQLTSRRKFQEAAEVRDFMRAVKKADEASVSLEQMLSIKSTQGGKK